jgi:hypothetical protein
MTWRELNLCVADDRNYCALMGLMGRMFGRVTVGMVIAFAFALTGASAASADVTGVVAGVQSPAQDGELELDVLAIEASGVGLRSATAFIDGQFKATGPFPDGACRANEVEPPPCPSTIRLNVATGKPLSDGDHVLTVVIEDMGGAMWPMWTQQFEVDNTPVESTDTVTVSVGSGTILGPPSGSGPPPPTGGGAPRCASPRLSMFLAQRPLGFVRGVPVLVAGQRYRYLGRLTCRVNGRRRPAPRGTRIEVRNRVRGRTFVKPGVKVRKDGLIVTKLAYPSSRVIVFRARGTSGDLVSVRIPIRVVHVKRRRS